MTGGATYAYKFVESCSFLTEATLWQATVLICSVLDKRLVEIQYFKLQYDCFRCVRFMTEVR